MCVIWLTLDMSQKLCNFHFKLEIIFSFMNDKIYGNRW